MKAKIKSRASRAAIFERLHRLLGPEAEPIIQRVIERLDSGDTTAGISELKAYDDTIGGYCGMPEEWCKPDGAYRPLGYVPMFLDSRHHRDMSRYVVDAIGQHVENLLQRIGHLGFLNAISSQMFPMGKLVKSMRLFLPKQLYEDLQWLASEVYNHAKHSLDVFHRPTPEERAHYFQLEEALAVFLIGRKLAVQLENWSGKTQEELMAER